MAVSQDDPNAHNHNFAELHEELVGIKGTKKKIKQTRVSHWPAYAIPIFVFILNKAILSLTIITNETKNLIDILIVIGIVAGLNIYSYYLNKEK